MSDTIKNITKTDEYIRNTFTNTNKYNDRNEYNSINAHYFVNEQLINFLASGKGALFLAKQYLLTYNNKTSAFLYNPLSLLHVPLIRQNHAFDAVPGNYSYDRIAKNVGDAKRGPAQSKTSKWGNVEQIKGPNGIVQPKGINDNINDVINRSLGVLKNSSSDRWDAKNTSLNDALQNNNQYYPIDDASTVNMRQLNINEILLNNGKKTDNDEYHKKSIKEKIEYAKSKAKTNNNDKKNEIIENHFNFNDVLAQSLPLKVDDIAVHEIENKDLIDFYFRTIKIIKESGENNISYDEICYFKAYIDSFDDSFSIEWDKMKDYGRVQSNVIYQGTDRSGKISFLIVIRDPKELIPTYKRINWLITNLAYPKYADNLYISKPPFFSLKVGDIYNNVIMYANSISVGYYDQKNLWEIENGVQVPTMFKINIDYGILYNGIPSNEINLFDIK